MKKIVLLLIGIVTTLFLQAQENSAGQVSYTHTVKLEIKLEGQAAQFAHMLPKERKSNKVLYFNDRISLFENQKKEEDENRTRRRSETEHEEKSESVHPRIKTESSVELTNQRSQFKKEDTK